MIDVGFINRVGGGIGIHDVLKGGVIKGEGFTGFSIVQISVYDTIYIKTQVFRLFDITPQHPGRLIEATGQPKISHTT